jgi:hypothetical protein
MKAIVTSSSFLLLFFTTTALPGDTLGFVPAPRTRARVAAHSKKLTLVQNIVRDDVAQ